MADGIDKSEFESDELEHAGDDKTASNLPDEDDRDSEDADDDDDEEVEA